MELLGSIGIDPKLLLAQAVNFVLLLILLHWLLYRPLMRRIEKDERELEEARTQSERLEQRKNAFEERRRKEQLHAQKEIRKTIHEAETIAETLKQQAREEIQREKQAVIAQIKSRLKEIEHGIKK